MIDRDQIVTTFLLEAADNLLVAEDTAIARESRPDDGEMIQALFRAIHTIEGDADSLGFEDTTRLAHALEDLLEVVRSGAVVVRPPLVTMVLECIDGLRATLQPAAPGDGDRATETSELV